MTTARFGFGRVFGQSFAVYARNFVPFAFLGLLVHAPYFLWTHFLVGAPPEMPQHGTFEERYAAQQETMAWFREKWPALLGSAVLSSLMAMVAASALSYGVVQELRGRRAGIGDCIARGVAGLGRTLLVALTVMARILVGLVLFVVPGVIEWCRLWVAIPAAVMEGGGARAAIRRSRDLTAGVKGTIFGFFVVFVLISGGLVQAAEWVLSSSEVPAVIRMDIETVIGILVGIWGSVASAVGYYALRMDREHVDLDQIASVFE